MNRLLFVFVIFALVGCKTSAQQDAQNLPSLIECFEQKDESCFLKQFPDDFDQFENYFGWDNLNDEPQELYEESYAYVDYWFDLLKEKKNRQYEENIISICTNGDWDADGVNYFQDKSLDYIKTNDRYDLINNLDDEQAKSVLFFLFDSPHPSTDEEFVSNLTSSKRELVNDLFEKDAFESGHGSKLDPAFQQLLEDDSFFSKDLDVNNDNVADKVFCSKPYEGDQLILYIRDDGSDTYKLALKTVNFSQDGGNQVTDIKDSKDGFQVKTAFPDGGLYESDYYISFEDGYWRLTNVVYTTDSGSEKGSFIYQCTVKQEGIDLGNPELWDQIKEMPEESQRERECRKMIRQ